MEIILLERVPKLGKMGDVVRVKDGYARNFLLPGNKALRANKANLALFESQRQEREQQNDADKAKAETLAKKLDKKNELVLIRQAGDTGQLYGSVTSRDIMQALVEKSIAVTRQQITLNTNIKVLGLHEASVMLHPEVEVPLVLNVARNQSEAKRQAAGEDVIATEQSKAKASAQTDSEPADSELSDSDPEAAGDAPPDAQAATDEATTDDGAQDDTAQDTAQEKAKASSKTPPADATSDPT